jgi:hypothetical protein
MVTTTLKIFVKNSKKRNKVIYFTTSILNYTQIKKQVIYFTQILKNVIDFVSKK